MKERETVIRRLDSSPSEITLDETLALKSDFSVWLHAQEPLLKRSRRMLLLFDLQGVLIAYWCASEGTGSEPGFFSDAASAAVQQAILQTAEARRPYEFIHITEEEAENTEGTLVASPVYRSSHSAAAVLCTFAADDMQDADVTLHLALVSSFQGFAQYSAEKRKNQKFSEERMEIERFERKRNRLFQATQQIHSQIDVNSILSDVIQSLREMYPKTEFYLYLSQDTQDGAASSRPVKPLNFNKVEQDICIRSFLQNQLLVESGPLEEGHKGSQVAVPISGKQGVYGVILLRFDVATVEMQELNFLQILGDSTGSAFENAKLYEQSNVLVEELRLINEITTRLSQRLKLVDIYSFAERELRSIFQADYCIILQFDRVSGDIELQAGNVPSHLYKQFSLDESYAGYVYRTKEALIISDYRKEERPVRCRIMEGTESRSLIAAPILVDGDMVGIIQVMHRNSGYFSYDNYKLLQVLSGHIGLAITNAVLHAEVRRMAITDHLTGLYARNHLDEQITRMQQEELCGSILLIDIDDFKKINDTYGHQVGDGILKQISSIVRSSLRETDVPARWGGEELAVYLPSVTLDQAMKIAERIRRRVSQETSPRVTVSGGVSYWQTGDEQINVESLFYRADMALYRAKSGGKDLIYASQE